MRAQNEDAGTDIIWGAEDIGKVIGRTTEQTWYLLRTGKIPARKVGDSWVASRAKLVAFLMEDAA